MMGPTVRDELMEMTLGVLLLLSCGEILIYSYHEEQLTLPKVSRGYH